MTVQCNRICVTVGCHGRYRKWKINWRPQRHLTTSPANTDVLWFHLVHSQVFQLGTTKSERNDRSLRVLCRVQNRGTASTFASQSQPQLRLSCANRFLSARDRQVTASTGIAQLNQMLFHGWLLSHFPHSICTLRRSWWIRCVWSWSCPNVTFSSVIKEDSLLRKENLTERETKAFAAVSVPQHKQCLWWKFKWQGLSNTFLFLCSFAWFDTLHFPPVELTCRGKTFKV